MKTFKELGLNAGLIKIIDELGFVEPTPVQAKAIPFLLKSKQDLIALAQTGTGKTAAFGLPILNQIKTDGKSLQAIILCPTRELCLQTTAGIKEFAKNSNGVDVTAVYGGERIDLQIRALRRGTNIVVGTPGRVKDLIRRNVLKLQTIQWVVLDEADEMLDMGFKDDMDFILAETPKERQTLLFSATMSRSVASIAKQYMKDAHEISVGDKNMGAKNVSHEYYVVQVSDRFEALKRILDYIPDVYGILFCRTKRETQEIADKLRLFDYDVEAIHGDVSQNIRTKIMDRFKKKQIKLLVATDVAARGIDVKDLTHVINYSLPDQNTSYTHRSGRTGRAEKTGVSIAMINSREVRRVKQLERVLGKPFEYKKIPRGEDIHNKLIDNFVDEVKNSDTENNVNQKHIEEIVDKLKSVKKEDLIKYFIAKELTHLIGESTNTRDLNAKVGSMGSTDTGTVLEVDSGKKNDLDIQGFFALINTCKNLAGIKIGEIEIKSEFTIFSVDPKSVDDVLDGLKGKVFRGQKIKVKKSDEQLSYSRARNPRKRSNNRGGYQGSRSGGRSSGGSGSRSTRKSYSRSSSRSGSRSGGSRNSYSRKKR